MILSGEMMARQQRATLHFTSCADALVSQLRHMRWNEAADLVIRGLEGAITARTVTYDFHRQARASTLARALASCPTDELVARRPDGAGGREGQAAEVLRVWPGYHRQDVRG